MLGMNTRAAIIAISHCGEKALGKGLLALIRLLCQRLNRDDKVHLFLIAPLFSLCLCITSKGPRME
jgi:hypothetical protein